MSNQRKIGTTLAAIVLSLTLGSFAGAQATPPANGAANNNNNAENNGGRRRRYNPQEYAQRRLDRIKQELGSTDAEWAAISPKVEKVLDLQRQEMMSRYAGRRGRSGREGGQASQSPVAKATADLRQAVEANAPANELSQKIQAVRDARQQEQDQVKKAQDDLKQLLTPKQEAQLVLAGVLD